MALLCTAAVCVSNHQADRAAHSLVGTWSAQAEEVIDSAGRTIASNPAAGVLVYTGVFTPWMIIIRRVGNVSVDGREHAVQAARFINDQYASVVRCWPDRFAAF